MTPLTLMTGFLGSGKTTLLNALLRDPLFADSGVIVNEIGSIGIDQLLVEAADDSALVLDGGCFCCTLKDGLTEAVVRLERTRADCGLPPVRRYLVETSGAASPLPLLQQLIGDHRLNKRVLLDGVVTLVDGLLGLETLDSQPEARPQAAVADLLVVTKADLAEPAALEALDRRLAALNPSAERVRAVQGDLPAHRLLGLGPDVAGRGAGRWLEPPQPEACAHEHAHDHDHGHPHAHDHAHGHDIRTASIELPGPLPAEALEGWVEEMMLAAGGQLLRMKGVVALDDAPDRPLAIHAVQHMVHAPVRLKAWPRGAGRGRVTLIARGVDAAILEHGLAALAAAAAPTAEPVAPAAWG